MCARSCFLKSWKLRGAKEDGESEALDERGARDARCRGVPGHLGNGCKDLGKRW